jgi:hypothetical protein
LPKGEVVGRVRELVIVPIKPDLASDATELLEPAHGLRKLPWALKGWPDYP